MTPKVLASQAILSTYARKVLRPVEVWASVVFGLALFGTAYLIMAFSGWWWLLMFVVILYGILASMLWLILRRALDHITPEQTPEQKNAVKSFINKSEKVATAMGISHFSLLLRIVQDVFRKKQGNVITEFTKDSADLAASFKDVLKSFEQ